MKSIFRWIIDKDNFVYLTKPNGEWLHKRNETLNLSEISDEVEQMSELEYADAFAEMEEYVRQNHKMRLYPYHYYYDIAKSNVKIVYGEVGEDGAQGPVGPQGVKGNRGAQGQRGEKGDNAVNKHTQTDGGNYAYDAIVYTKVPSGSAEPSIDKQSGDYNFDTDRLTLPTGNEANGGWKKDNDFPEGDDIVVYMSTRTFYFDRTKNTKTFWIKPIRLSGRNGEDSETENYIYKVTRSNDEKDKPSRPNNPTDRNNKPTTPNGWYNHRQPISESAKCCWYCVSLLSYYSYEDEDGDIQYAVTEEEAIERNGKSITKLPKPLWGNWIGPSVDSCWGTNGNDGDGIEYIFAQTDTKGQKPEAPVESADTDMPDINTKDWHGIGVDRYGNKTLWTDNPVTLDGSKNKNWQWCSIRKVSATGYGEYGTPSFWNRYVSDAEKGTSISLLAAFETYDDLISNTNRGILTYSKDGNITTKKLEIGDAVIAGGRIYVWDGDSWVNGGSATGTPSYLHTKYGKMVGGKIEFTDNINIDIDYNVDVPTGAKNGDKWFVGNIKYILDDGVVKECYEVGEYPLNAKYIGICTDDKEEDPIDVNAYMWSKFVGDDGFGVEYIFKTTSTYDAPKVPGEGKSPNKEYEYGEKIVKEDSKYFQSPDFVPNGWADDHIGVNSTQKYEWVCSRKYVNGKWQNFKGDEKGNAVLYANYSEMTEGATGKNAPIIYPAGYYDEVNGLYTRTEKSAPYVKYGDSYYIYIGDESKDFPQSWDAVKNSNVYPEDSVYWIKMEGFNALFTEFLIADNGKLGSAVFNGHYMFSQYGWNLLSNSPTYAEEYQNFFKLDPYYTEIAKINSECTDSINNIGINSLTSYISEIGKTKDDVNGNEQLLNYTKWRYLYNVFDNSRGIDKNTIYYKLYKTQYESDLTEDFKKSEFAKPVSFSASDTNKCLFVPNWCVDLYTGKMWTNHGLTVFNTKEVTMKSADGETIFEVNDEGDLTLVGEIHSRGTHIVNPLTFVTSFIPSVNSGSTDNFSPNFIPNSGDLKGNMKENFVFGYEGNTKITKSVGPVSNLKNNAITLLTDGNSSNPICVSLDMRFSKSAFIVDYYKQYPIWNDEKIIDKQHYSLNIMLPFFYYNPTGSKFLRTPCRIGNEFHFITFDEMLSMVGDRISIINNSGRYIEVHGVCNEGNSDVATTNIANPTTFVEWITKNNPQVPCIRIEHGKYITCKFTSDPYDKTNLYYWRLESGITDSGDAKDDNVRKLVNSEDNNNIFGNGVSI